MVSSELLRMQSPQGVPRSSLVETVTDPLLPPQRTADMLAHFFDRIYDLRPESHISRLMKVLLGDTGAGQLRKKYVYAHLSQVLMTTHFFDLDRLFADVFGLKRFVRERLPIDPYNEAATDEQWEAISAADASYRGRMEQFARAIPWGGTPTGVMTASAAILGQPVRVYETYTFLNDEDTYAAEEEATVRTYGDLESMTYGEMNGVTYARLESVTRYQGRLADSRGEFVIRPMQAISDEEKYQLSKAVARLKPAGALMTIDNRGTEVYSSVPVFRVWADSSYWHIRTRVASSEENASLYSNYDDGRPVEQPRPAFSAYQGEAWSYNTDVVTVTSSVQDEQGHVLMDSNFERRIDPRTKQVTDYSPDQALMDPVQVMLGRYVSDGVLASPAVERQVAAR